jgi:hypothetical protein
MRRPILSFSCLAAILILPSSAEVGRAPLPLQRIEITARPVALDQDDPRRVQLGSLRYRGGWILKSDSPEFGGLSALSVSGDSAIAIGDVGTVVRFRLFPKGRVGDATISELPLGCGMHWFKAGQDSESLTHDPVSGKYWIGLEWRNAICRLDAGLRHLEIEARPQLMRRWPITGGAEAMVRLHDGRFLVFAERAGDDDDPLTPALLFDGDPVLADTPVSQLQYRAPEGFRAVDAAQLPDGRLLILNRRFSFPNSFASRLQIIDPAEIQPGAILTGQEIARFESPVVHDNLEGLSVEDAPAGPIVWITSDDNFSPLQQTLLLKFQLTE